MPIRTVYRIVTLLLIHAVSFGQTRFHKDSVQILPHLLRGEQIYQKQLDSSVYYWKKGLALTNQLMFHNKAQTDRYLVMKAVFLNDLGYSQLFYGKKDVAQRYFDSCMSIQVKLKLWEQYALALNNVANIYLNDANYSKAIELFLKSIDIYNANGKMKELPMVYSNIGMAYKKIGDYDKAIDYFFEAERLAEKYNKKDKPSIYLNISEIYLEQKDTANFKKYITNCVVLCIYRKDMNDLAYSYLKMGSFYSKINKHLAYYYYIKSLGIRRGLQDKNGIANTLYNIASLTTTDSSLARYREAKNIYREIGDREGYNYCLMMEGVGEKRNGQLQAAEKHLLEAYNDFKKINSINGQILAADYLHTLYEEKKDPAQALLFFKKHAFLKDSVNTYDLRKKTLQKNLANEFEKKAEQIEKDHLIREKILEKDKEQQRLLTIGIMIILLVVFGFSIVIFRNLQQKKKANRIIVEQKQEVERQKDIIENKQKEIVDSINYAQQIQKTLLANHDIVNEVIPDSFVFFQPKDIVSGDFYWATKKDQLLWLAVCDCTGHGVPGAFMSLLNISFLNEAINEKNIQEPGQVFNFVRQRLIGSIAQSGRQDGMDGILICYNPFSRVLSYAAANNKPLRISEGELSMLDHDKMPVGKGTRNDEFNTRQFLTKKGDMLYLFTDGFADQFGGPGGKKFKTKRLETTLEDLSKLSTIEQCTLLKETFHAWKGKQDQVDDVCVLGIRF